MKFYNHFFSLLYLFMSKTPGRRTADDSALMVIVCVELLYTVSLPFALIDYFFEKANIVIFLITGLSYALFLYKVNSSYFFRKKKWEQMVETLKAEKKSVKSLLSIILIVVILFSVPSFFLMLKLF